MSTVYMVQESFILKHNKHTGALVGTRPKFNTDAAKEFGDIVVLLPSGSEYTPVRMKSVLDSKLRNFTEDDFLLPTGSPVCISWAAIIAAKYSTKVNMLQWDKREGRYYVI